MIISSPHAHATRIRIIGYVVIMYAEDLPEVIEFSEELNHDQLYSFLKHKQVPKNDRIKIWSKQ